MRGIRKFKAYKSSVFSVLIAVFILSVLLLAGPGKAFLVDLDIVKSEINKGELVNFSASVLIEAQEYLDFDYLTLRFTGPQEIECRFFVNGTMIDVDYCEGIDILQISSANYKYGYGFEEGLLKYNITLNSSEYFAGNYSTYLDIVKDEEVLFSEQGENVIVKGIVEEMKRCSIRAKKGNLVVNQEDFLDNNKLNLYIPLKTAAAGEGYLTGQINRQRFSYEYNIVEVLENDFAHLVVLVTGEYKIERGEEIKQDAVIFLDKINEKISVTSSDIKAKEMDVSFISGC